MCIRDRVELLANGKVAILVKNTGKPIDPEKIKDVLVQKTDVSSNGIGLQYVARIDVYKRQNYYRVSGECRDSIHQVVAG